MKRTAILLTVLAILFLVGSALAMRSDNYWLDWYVMLTGGGGGATDSTNYAANLTIGQTARGLSSNTNYSVGLGYWYGAAPTPTTPTPPPAPPIYLPIILKNF